VRTTRACQSHLSMRCWVSPKAYRDAGDRHRIKANP
jgi:hypothetical protein